MWKEIAVKAKHMILGKVNKSLSRDRVAQQSLLINWKWHNIFKSISQGKIQGSSPHI